MALPGFSTTLVVVPTGPGYCCNTCLNPLANDDPGVVGTIMVAVAPSFLNHVLLSAFSNVILLSLDLYNGLPWSLKLARLLLCLARTLSATILLVLS